MGVSLPETVQQLLRSLFSDKGRTSQALRQSVEAYGEQASGVNTTPGEIPANLTAYLDKVVHYAYKVTDKDINRLKEAGYSEDEIYELTLSAALGSGVGRMKRGLMALRGEGKG